MERSITVTGRGVVSVAPDCARIQFGVQVVGVNAQDVLGRSNGAIADIVEAVRGSGVDPADLQTSGPRLWPGDRGYVGSQDVSVLVRDVHAVGPLIDTVATAGGPNLTMHGLSFSVLDQAPHLDEARRRAVRDALDVAEALATAAGCTVGEVLSITEGGPGFGGMGIAMAAKADHGAVIEPGAQELSADVTVTCRLAPAG